MPSTVVQVKTNQVQHAISLQSQFSEKKKEEGRERWEGDKKRRKNLTTKFTQIELFKIIGLYVQTFLIISYYSHF